MKKIILSTVVALMALTANAQMYIGGSVGFSYSNVKTEYSNYSKESDTNGVTVNPEFGFNINKYLAIGMKLNYQHLENYEVSNYSGTANVFGVNPYIRFTYARVGRFSAFLDTGGSYANAHVNGYSDYIENPQSYSVAINPGIAFELSPAVSLVAHVGDFSYTYSEVKTKKVDAKYSTSNFNAALYSNVSIGVYININGSKDMSTKNYY